MAGLFAHLSPAAQWHCDESQGSKRPAFEVRDLVPVHDDFNVDLCCLGPSATLARLVEQLVSSDVVRFRDGRSV
jgi:hypothetical protein